MYEEGLPTSMSSRDYDIDFDDAIELADGSYINKRGTIFWYNEEGYYHREDGPAIIHTERDWDVEWCLNSVPYKFAEWCTLVSISDEDAMMLRLRYE
jgi:hypothetical protein